MRGLFITFEGLDGSGKTSVLNQVKADLETTGKKNYIFTREPGGNRIAEAVRAIILDKKNTEMAARTEALLYAAARSQHVVETIEPALAAGKVVFCDRYVDSSLVYQGAGRHIGINEVAAINLFATQGLEADLTFYFKIQPQVGLERIKDHRQDQIDRMDSQDVSFYEETYAAYERLAQENPSRYVVIDANRPLAEVVAAVSQQLSQRVGQYLE